ncbi:hypothetical protein AB0B31_27730 [Catellatospora citrea]|uniref:hypothetical protein n=1 Tax=Catellatospora citrea TaxID=53366 RepID=UPI0033F414DF
MKTITLEIAVTGTENAAASANADELREFLLDEDSGIEVRLQKSDPDAQDFGAVLQVVLALPSVVLLARGVQKWISLRQTSTVRFKSGPDELVVTNLSSRGADALARDLMALSTARTPEV